MRIKEIKIFSFDELSEESKLNAIKNYRDNNIEIFWADETLDSLKGLFYTCNDVSLQDYSLGENNSWLRVAFTHEEVENFSGKRAMAWLENNLLFEIRIPNNSLSDNGKRKELAQYGQYYRAVMIKPCPFTGYCADEDFLNSLVKDIKEGADLKTAFEGLASIYQKIINNEIDYQNSEEYIAEHFTVNEYEFDEDGNKI